MCLPLSVVPLPLQLVVSEDRMAYVPFAKSGHCTLVAVYCFRE